MLDKARSSMLPIILLLILVSAIIIYHEKGLCVENDFTNCKVTKWSFERIAVGQDYEIVKSILGTKNMEGLTHPGPKECAGADSILLWGSNKYRESNLTAICVGFKDRKVHCKAFIQAGDTKGLE